jgi:hypothetical protein
MELEMVLEEALKKKRNNDGLVDKWIKYMGRVGGFEFYIEVRWWERDKIFWGWY